MLAFFLLDKEQLFNKLLLEPSFQKINVKNMVSCQGNTCWSVKAVF